MATRIASDFRTSISKLLIVALLGMCFSLLNATAKEKIIATVCSSYSGRCAEADNSANNRWANKATWRQLADVATTVCRKESGYGCEQYHVCSGVQQSITLNLPPFKLRGWCPPTPEERRWALAEAVGLCVSNKRQNECNINFHVYGGGNKQVNTAKAELDVIWVQFVAYYSGLSDQKPTGVDGGELSSLIEEIQTKYGQKPTGEYDQFARIALSEAIKQLQFSPEKIDNTENENNTIKEEANNTPEKTDMGESERLDELHVADFSSQSGKVKVSLDSNVLKISTTGDIDLNVANDVKQALRIGGYNHAELFIESPGGEVESGLAIATAVHDSRVTVIAQRSCTSICAVIWLSSEQRSIREGASVGFHAASDQQFQVSAVGNALIGAHFAKIGIAKNIIQYVVSAPPAGIHWLTSEEANLLGITYSVR